MATALGVAPTRMELIKLRRRISLAQKGHDLLKEKMDALIMEFFTILKDIEDIRAKALDQLSKAFRAVSVCQAEMGTIETFQAVKEMKRDAALEIYTRYIMGVPVPRVEIGFGEGKREYPVHGTSASMDRAVQEFERALQELIKLAELEAAARALAEELERTKRRVNALEYVVIPRLQQMIKFIQSRLDEIERENFTRLKRIKAILERRSSRERLKQTSSH